RQGVARRRRTRAWRQCALRARAPGPATARPVAERQGIKLNWTVAQAGTNRNVIPARATAQADARALRVSDFDALQAKLQERVKNQLVPDAKVQRKFEVRRPPLEATPASRKLAAHGKAIYDELGLPMTVADVATGGGTDAAFA